MTAIDDKDQCIAITNEGTRCSRIAKDEAFCFQHDSSSEVIESRQTESQGFVNLVSDQIKDAPDSLSGVQRDIMQNFHDLVGGTREISGGLLSANFDEALNALREAARSSAATTTKYAAVGGTAGMIGGPVGVAAGVTGGAWYGVYKVANDDRAVRAQVISDIPNGADVISLSDPSIKNVEPIQMAIRSAIETDETETEWLRPTIFREQNMDEVEEALNQVPVYQNEKGIDEYYIRDENQGETLLLVFGVPIDD